MKFESILFSSLVGHLGLAHAAVVPVTGITGHNGGNFSPTLGHLTDMVNATNIGWATSDHNPGINTSAAPNNPALWVNNTTTWQSEWLASSRLNSTTSANNKIGWVVMDFGSVKADLENIYLWNCRFNVAGEDTRNFNIYYSSGVGINALPARPNSTVSAGDYNFSSGYQEEWMATYLKVGATVTPGLNGKVAWACLDFGSKTPLGMLYLFNTNYGGGTSSTDQFNLYFADSPAIPLPAQPAKGTYATTGLTPQADHNFSGGGWTLFNTAAPLAATKAGITSLNLPGVSARYLAIEILSNQGDTNSGGRAGFDEIAITAAPPDTDNDGMPDAFELAHTIPPSTTTLAPAVDIEPDGLTNLQEYVRGTNPLLADTDSDGLNDGPETLGTGSRPTTNPLAADSDADGLNDLVESNTGVWASAANTGTSPVNPDTDADGLTDSVETNTGTFVSISSTGTSPLNSNSDGDNATDWYEVVIIDKNPALGSPPNSPNDPTLKPNIPYPLPDPDTSTGATDKPVKVYIMSGQSNMVGFGQISGTGPGTLQRMTSVENKFPNLVGPTGAWTTRNDVTMA